MISYKIYATIFLLFFISSLYSQDFLDGQYSFARKDTSYIKTRNGKEYVGKIVKYKMVKGLIQSIVVEVGDQQINLKSEEVANIYAKPSRFNRVNSYINDSKDITRFYYDKSIHQEHIMKGYNYFESVNIYYKKTDMTPLLQLVNPGTSKGIKVYADPYTTGSASVSAGGVQVAGGFDKSYFVKKGNKKAIYLTKGNFDKYEKELFGDCPEIFEKFGKDLSWFDLSKIIRFYSENCGK